ncbi:MAG: mannose-6-phosphate isomerase, class I [Jatrophihabitantaceae bacterium]
MPVPPVVAIEGVVRTYAWGSTTAIQRLLGTEPDGVPAAELWFGAHPGDPALVPSLNTTLSALIAADPVETLGARTVSQFGPRLPFLLKVLAADKALSMQVHPTLAQAQAGFAAEDAAGIARDAVNRNYRDANHKPELLCALTPFEALCGFRPVADTLAMLDDWAVPEFAPVRESLAQDGLRAAFTYLLTLADSTPLVAAVAARAAQFDPSSPWAGPARAAGLAAADFPGDIGAVLSLLLNYIVLQPGEATYLSAGTVHAYLRGTGVEIMATSDNVLRCGLTPKHIDVPELLKITNFTELADPRWPDDGAPFGFSADFRVPVADFALHSADLDAYRKPAQDVGSCATGTAGLPYLVLCASGSVRVDVDGTTVDLAPGHAAFVPAREQAFTLRGTGQTFLATVG